MLKELWTKLLYHQIQLIGDYRMKKVVMGVTNSLSITLLRGQFKYFSDKGYQIHLITSDGPELNDPELENVILHTVPMKREIALFSDLVALIKIIMIYLKVKPDISNVSTPKASLLCSIAAFLSRTKVRIYSVIGLRLETCTALKRKILYVIEKLIIKLSTLCLAVSPSLKEALITNGLASPSKIKVLASGSYNGIQFDRLKREEDAIQKTKQTYSLKGPVIGFVGRLTRDKGVNELVQSFLYLLEKIPDATLLLVGGFEEGDPVDGKVKECILTNPHIIYTGFVKNPSSFYYNMDIFILPTYREGFGNVLIEAAYCYLPVITTNVTGAKDAILPNETGLLVEAGNELELYEATLYLLNNPNKAQEMAKKGHYRSEENYPSIRIWKELEKVYQNV